MYCILQSYQFVVTAKDGAVDPRIATATVSVSVIDLEDELPLFRHPMYEASVPENVPDYFVIDVVVCKDKEFCNCFLLKCKF